MEIFCLESENIMNVGIGFNLSGQALEETWE